MFRIEPMDESDIPEVSKVERHCFSNPWPQSAYRRELRNKSQNRYVVLRLGPGTADEWMQQPERTNGRSFRLRLPLPQLGRRAGNDLDEGSIIGFSGFWILFDEAHITTIGVDPRFRRRHLGELLLLDVVEAARRQGARYLSLEVRKSNGGAIQLYEKYGFSIRGVRPNYYTDDGEDALVMWSGDIRTPAFREQLQRLRGGLEAEFGDAVGLPESADAVLFQPLGSETAE